MKWIFQTLTLILVASLAPEAWGETLVTQGNLRWVYRNSPFGVRPLAFRSISPNLLSMGGMLYEKDRFGTIRPLFLNRNSGALVGMQEPTTRMEVAKLYSAARERVRGEFGNIVDRFLTNMGLVAPKTPVSRPVTSGGFSSPGANPRGLFEDKKGKHGNGSTTSQSARGSSSPSRTRPTAGARATVPSSVCSDLNHAICRSNPKAANEVRMVENYKQGIVRGFVNQNRLGANFLPSLFGGILQNPGKFKNAYRAFTGFLSGKVPGVEAAVRSAKSAFLASIDKQPLSPTAKAMMKAKVAGVTIRMAPNFSSAQALQGFVQNCGADGMAPGAFAVPPLNEVVVCPGLALEAAVRGGDIAGHLTHVLSHEIGHHCGCDVDPFGRPGPFFSQYTQMRACYQEHYKILPSMAGEIAADFWGVESLLKRLDGKSKADAFNEMVNAMRPLCGSPADGVHPSGRFRINVTLGRHPEVRKLLGCSAATAEKPACLLEGAVPKTGTGLADAQ